MTHHIYLVLTLCLIGYIALLAGLMFFSVWFLGLITRNNDSHE